MTQDEPPSTFSRLRISSPPQNASSSLRLTDPTTPTSSLGFLKRSMENQKSMAYNTVAQTPSNLDTHVNTPTSSFGQPRRARAGTMPSQSSISPYAPIGSFSATTATVPGSLSEVSSFSAAPGSSSLLSSSSRHRSGSLTLPKPSLSSSAFGHPVFSTSWSDHNRHLYGNAPLTPTTDQMLREDDSESIVRTLMSLGLDDDDRKNNSSQLAESQANTTSTPEIRLPVELPPKPLMNSNRYRSYSVNAKDKYIDPFEITDQEPSVQPSRRDILLADPTGLTSYYPSTQNRARAVSLGMADFAKDGYLPRYNQPSASSSALRREKLDEEMEDEYNTGGNHHMAALEDKNDMLNRVYNSQEPSSIPEVDEPYLYGSSLGSQFQVPQGTSAQTPTRSLWIGNIDMSVAEDDLRQMFSPYGPIESLRLLTEKECAFINFVSLDDAVRAKDDVLGKLNGRIGQCIVRVGFGKIEASATDSNTLQPTRALWIGSLPVSTSSAKLHSIFSHYGNIESARVLTHKNCGFINFDTVENAVAAKKALQQKEVFGPGTGLLRIGFAKATTSQRSSEDLMAQISSSASQPTPDSGADLTDAKDHGGDSRLNVESATKPTKAEPTLTETSNLSKIMAIMMELGMDSDDGPVFKIENRTTATYHPTIPPVSEPNANRKLDVPRLREVRKKLDSAHTSAKEVQAIAEECMDDIVELSSGNTVVQKLFERCSEDTKLKMLRNVAPHLATIGVHKNGTWAAQKIIDTATRDDQMKVICEHIQPYVPPLMLDQFGNYVVQCCLRLGTLYNQFIFDAIVDKTKDIAQGRFGARAIRACLDSPHVSMRQKKYAASAIIANVFSLGGNPNGALLVTWLLDTSGLPKRYNILAPRLAPYMSAMCTNKLASMGIVKVINQRQEIEAQLVLLNTLANDDSDQVLRDILADSNLGINVIHKILTSSSVEALPKRYLAEKVNYVLSMQTPPAATAGQAFKRLSDEVANILNESRPLWYDNRNNASEIPTNNAAVAGMAQPPPSYLAAAYGSPPGGHYPITPSSGGSGHQHHHAMPMYPYPMPNNMYANGPGFPAMPPYGYYAGMPPAPPMESDLGKVDETGQ
ncbi:hypothetical protein INT43_008966 [Umbelopsis isabellina]|uniref:Uncharacterized protein n=1 Tax=Mortierella isabellina TaxID=91625 RepID=A0A8H7PW73_MORIS|nr:hypothetical protein INT43_008966 [Umbelopsis isabellina]